MELNLKNKTALVTGSARGLGKSICEVMAQEGVNIVLNDIKSQLELSQEVAASLSEQYGVRAVAVAADVSCEADVTRMFDEAQAALGCNIDYLINNAGICPVVDIIDTSYELWKKVMNINVDGIFLTSKEFAKRRIADGLPGRIVNVASQAAFNGSKRGKTHYSASKGAVVSFTISFSKEVAKYNILVNAVAPGMMLTEMTQETLELAGEIEKYNAAITIGRLGYPVEVAKQVALLCSEAMTYSTGAVFDVTGGLMAR